MSYNYIENTHSSFGIKHFLVKKCDQYDLKFDVCDYILLNIS